MSTDYGAIARHGVAALRRGDGEAARAAFAQVEAAGRQAPTILSESIGIYAALGEDQAGA